MSCLRPTTTLVRTVREKVTKKITATDAIHRICWRASPWERRNRMTIAATARAAANRVRKVPTAVAASIGPARESMPRGLAITTLVRVAKVPNNRLGAIARPAVASTGPPMASHSAGRQRRDGIRPSGNSRTSGTRQPRSGTSAHPSTQAAARAKGSDPGYSARPYVA